jgi:hypothetical protein
VIPSRSLVIPGLRERPYHPWRTDVASAVSVVVGQPYLWLLGVLGVALRGGIVLLALPIVVLPTQVEVRLALGSNLGSTGLTPGFWTLVGVGTVASAALALVVLYALARIELAAFNRLTAGEPTTQLRGHALMGRLFVIQALTLLALGVAAMPLAAAVGEVTLDEILRPSAGGSIYQRVFGQVGQPLVLFVGALMVVDTLAALATRRLLMPGRRAEDGAARRASIRAALVYALAQPLLSPLRTIGTAALGWLSTFAAVAVAWVGLSLAWRATRAAFLSVTSVFDIQQIVFPVLVALLLAAAFAAGWLFAGIASAFRAALWSIQFKR